jgi:hypothetical protein
MLLQLQSWLGLHSPLLRLTSNSNFTISFIDGRTVPKLRLLSRAMAELVAAVAGAGLASSIITFLQAAYSVGKRTAKFRTAGELPSDLKATGDLIDIIARSAERLKSKLPGFGISGPPTQKEIDLNATFKRLTSLVNDFLSILHMIDVKNPLWKAWQSVRKEREVSNIRTELDRVIILITQILTESLQSSMDDLK